MLEECLSVICSEIITFPGTFCITVRSTTVHVLVWCETDHEYGDKLAREKEDQAGKTAPPTPTEIKCPDVNFTRHHLTDKSRIGEKSGSPSFRVN